MLLVTLKVAGPFALQCEESRLLQLNASHLQSLFECERFLAVLFFHKHAYKRLEHQANLELVR